MLRRSNGCSRVFRINVPILLRCYATAVSTHLNPPGFFPPPPAPSMTLQRSSSMVNDYPMITQVRCRLSDRSVYLIVFSLAGSHCMERDGVNIREREIKARKGPDLTFTFDTVVTVQYLAVLFLMLVQMEYDRRCFGHECLHLYREGPSRSRDDRATTQDAMQSKGPLPLC